MTGTRLLSTLALIWMAALVGCGGDDEKSNTNETVTQPSAQLPTPDREAEKVEPTPGEADINTKPEIPKEKGKPPSDLVIQDLISGEGDEARAGAVVTVQYVGVLFKNGKEFDSSWRSKKKPGRPFEFLVGAGSVIPGWDQGVVGMKDGGRRKLFIPPVLAYGDQGFPPDIPPNSYLIFEIDLKSVRKPESTPAP